MHICIYIPGIDYSFGGGGGDICLNIPGIDY